MSQRINIVFAQPPDGVSDEDFNGWYDQHIDEILAVPGFAAAQRFRIAPEVVDPEVPAPYSYIAIFEVDADPETITAEKTKRGLITKESYRELKKSDPSGPPLPDWWDGVRFASWNAVAVSERAEAR